MFEKRFVYYVPNEGGPKAPGGSETVEESTEVKLEEKYMSKVERFKLYGEVDRALTSFDGKPEKTPRAERTADKLKQSVATARAVEEKYKMDEGALQNEEAASVHRIYERLMRMAGMEAPADTVLVRPLTPFPNPEGPKPPPKKPADVIAAPVVAPPPKPPKEPEKKPDEKPPVVASVKSNPPQLMGLAALSGISMNVPGPTAGPEAEARGPKIPAEVQAEAKTRLENGGGEVVFADKEGTFWLARAQEGGKIDIRLDPKHVPPEYVKKQAEKELDRARDESWGKQANFQDKYGYYWIAVKRNQQSLRIVLDSTRMI